MRESGVSQPALQPGFILGAGGEKGLRQG